MNGFKLANQRKRALSLVGVIDAALLADHKNPIDQAGKALLALMTWTDDDWARAAKVARLGTPPSPETRAMVRQFFRDRAMAPLAPMVLQ